MLEKGGGSLHSQGQYDCLSWCQKGITAEFQTHKKLARHCFEQAWKRAQTPYEKSVAAHYLGHSAQNAASALAWHKMALEQALMAAETLSAHFFASLYVNLGQSYEALNQQEQAEGYYVQARTYGLEHHPEMQSFNPSGADHENR